MVVNVNCAGCNTRCSAKIKDISELNATWYCSECFDSHDNTHTSYKTAEQQALDELKKFCIA